MPTLLEVQRQIGAFLTGTPSAAADFVLDDGIAPEGRLQIYRNTYIGNLVGALRISYPAVRRLVGEEFFEGAARAFIDDHPPGGAYLNAYGAQFGDFLGQFPAAQSLAYLADVARLEWAVNVALHAEDAPPLDAARLMTLAEDDVVFVADPSVTLLRLEQPADAIWRAVIEENDEALAAIDPSEGPVFALVSRRNDAVSVERMSEREWRFTFDLCSGVPLSLALQAADADMSTSLAGHLAAGRFIDVRTEP